MPSIRGVPVVHQQTGASGCNVFMDTQPVLSGPCTLTHATCTYRHCVCYWQRGLTVVQVCVIEGDRLALSWRLGVHNDVEVAGVGCNALSCTCYWPNGNTPGTRSTLSCSVDGSGCMRSQGCSLPAARHAKHGGAQQSMLTRSVHGHGHAWACRVQCGLASGLDRHAIHCHLNVHWRRH